METEKYLQKVENDLIKLHNNTKGNSGNLTPNEMKALSELRANKNIIIKRADKGRRIVLWPREMYLAEARKQLTDEQYYSNVPKDHTPEVAIEIETFLTFLCTKNSSLNSVLSSYNHNTQSEPQCSTYYQKYTNKANQVDQSFQGAILQQKASQISQPLPETNCGNFSPIHKGYNKFLESHTRTRRNAKKYNSSNTACQVLIYQYTTPRGHTVLS